MMASKIFRVNERGRGGSSPPLHGCLKYSYLGTATKAVYWPSKGQRKQCFGCSNAFGNSDRGEMPKSHPLQLHLQYFCLTTQNPAALANEYFTLLFLELSSSIFCCMPDLAFSCLSAHRHSFQRRPCFCRWTNSEIPS